MKKLIGVIAGVLLIFCQLNYCDALAIASSSSNFEIVMTKILDSLKNDPSSNQVTEDIENLIQNCRTIEGSFIRITNIKRDVVNGKDHSEVVANVDLPGLRQAIVGIRTELVKDNIISMLKKYFTRYSQKSVDVCEIGQSHLQFLSSFIESYKTIENHYFLTNILSLELQEVKGSDNTAVKQQLKDEINDAYPKVVRKLKDIMNEASTEFWRCDPTEGYNDGIRYTDEKDPNFAELRIFTKYIVGEETFAGSWKTCEKMKCASITELWNCPKWETRLCTQVRACPGELVGCRPFTYGIQPGMPPGLANHHVKICKNADKNAYHRYLSVVETHKPDENFQCDKPAIKVRSTANLGISFGAQGNLKYEARPANEACEQCNCLCQEKDMYFVDLQNVDADQDKVVTGAKLVVEDNILRIQIEQSKLLSNGTIDKNTLEWKPLQPIDKKRLQWIYYEFRKFALNPIILPDDEVVTGLRFHAKQVDSAMVYLLVNSKKIDFRTGTFVAQNKARDSVPIVVDEYIENKYDLSERDASTKSQLKNKPDSTVYQFVELTVTSSAKDGGQSVIPFIDTQKVSANGPLSGASLYIRGQSGYGGFLGIKLYTFDVREYIDDYVGL